MKTSVFVIILILILVLTIIMSVSYLKDRTLEEIRADTYQLFLKAEHAFRYSGAGKQKMEWVISRARSLLPSWAQAFITEESLRKILELWFREVKDLLDDGKVNGSQQAGAQ